MKKGLKIVEGSVIENKPIAKGVYQMVIEALDVALLARGGQFVNLYTSDSALLLPRPISICWVDGASITLVYGVVGKGTKEFSTYACGDTLRLSLPLGNGYNLTQVTKGQSALLVGGGMGVAPLLELTYDLTQKGVEVKAVVGFKEEPFLMKPLIKAGADLYVATDAGTAGFHGNAVELIKREGLLADAYFACGPRPMLRALSAHVLSLGSDIQLSMEERMGCGYGACVGCVCKVREKQTDGSVSIKQKKVCSDGPVFWGSEVVFHE